MKAQVSAEFLVFVGVATLVLIIALSFISEDMTRITRERDIKAMMDLGYYMQNEIFLAAKVKDGYHRTFTIPESKDGVSYSINVYGNSSIILLSERGIEREFRTPDFVGNFSKGQNTLEKQGGIIYLNR